MKIGVLSHCQMPTLGTGGNGLGRVAWDLATGLKARGHEVTLYAGAGSEWDGRVITHEHENTRAMELNAGNCEAWLDLSHYQAFSQRADVTNAVAYVMDLESRGGLKNCAVANEYQQTIHTGARVIPLGIDVEAIPLTLERGDSLIYASKLHALKGFDYAIQVAKLSGRWLTAVGENFGMHIPDWVDYVGHVADNALLWRTIGMSAGLLATSRKDAGGRVILEASAVGTPVLTFDWTGCRCHVEHGVSGWICESVAEMVDAVRDLELINPKTAREWVADCHGLSVMIEGVEEALSEVAEGGGW